MFLSLSRRGKKSKLHLGDCKLISHIQLIFLVSLSPQYGREFDDKNGERSRLWLLIGFEHIVFAAKMLIAFAVPDVPGKVRLAMLRKEYRVSVCVCVCVCMCVCVCVYVFWRE